MLERPRDLVGSLEKGLDVLSTLATRPAGMTLTEMAEAADLTRAGARRLLLTLVATGYADQDGRRFRLSPRLLTLARQWLDGTSLWAFAEPHMRKVAAALKESCSAAVLSGTDVVYVARVPGERITTVTLQVGTRLPAYCTSMGRVLLSGLPEPELRDLLARSEISKLTEKTVTARGELAGLVRQAGEDGFGLVDEELEIGLRSIAVPIRDRTGAIVAAVNVSTPSARHSPAVMRREFLPLLRQAAEDIETCFALQ
jgi:IclR family transcriptional regulator, pca regulon regulatory protein